VQHAKGMFALDSTEIQPLDGRRQAEAGEAHEILGRGRLSRILPGHYGLLHERRYSVAPRRAGQQHHFSHLRNWAWPCSGVAAPCDPDARQRMAALASNLTIPEAEA
jgi:hypothetical protein